MEQLQGFNSMHGTEEELIETIDELAVIHIKTVSDHYKMQIGYLQDHDGVTQEQFAALVGGLLDQKLIGSQQLVETGVATKEQLERWRDPGNVPQVLESRNPMLIALLKSYLTVLAEDSGERKGRMVCVTDLLAHFE